MTIANLIAVFYYFTYLPMPALNLDLQFIYIIVQDRDVLF